MKGLWTMTEEKKKAGQELPDVTFDEFQAPDYETWKEAATALLKGGSFEKKLFTKTYEGITLEPMYTMEMAPSPEKISNLPGAENYMRGTHVGGYMTDPWKISQQADVTEPKKMNTLIRHELDKGSTAINIALDYASRHGQAVNTINKESIKTGGVSLSTIEDINEMFRDIDFDKNSLYIDSGAENGALVAMLAAMCRANGEKTSKIHGTIGADPIGVLAEEGKLPVPLDILFDEMAQTTRWAEQNVPQLRTILVQGKTYSDGGASAVQELGCVLATAISYIRALELRGLDINCIARHMQFSFSLGANFFMEIAKLRAARMVWSQIVESFGGDKEAQKMSIHARTALFNKTKWDPYVNMLRATTESFSAVIGGIDSLQVMPFDACIQLPDEFSRRIARNTQIILQNECNLCKPIDPAGGSWYVESLTQKVAEKAWQVMQDIEDKCGIAKTLVDGDIQKDIKDVLVQRLLKLARRSDRAVGINMYANLIEKPIEQRKIDTIKIRKNRLDEVAAFKADVDVKERDAKLMLIHSAFMGKRSGLVETMEEAFMAGAALDEVVEILHEGKEPLINQKAIEKHRFTEQFEELRNRAKAYEEKQGEKLKIFLCNIGKIPQHKPRAEFSTGFMEVGGFEVLKNDGFMTPEEAVTAAVNSKAFAAIICSTDATYPELVPPIAKGIREKRPDMIVMLAGAPAPDFEQSYRDAGVETFIHVRADCLEILTWLQQQGGIA